MAHRPWLRCSLCDIIHWPVTVHCAALPQQRFESWLVFDGLGYSNVFSLRCRVGRLWVKEPRIGTVAGGFVAQAWP